MENLKSEIYELCNKLRSLENWGLENSNEYKRIHKKVLLLNNKLQKAKKFLENYFDKCSKTYYSKPIKRKSYKK